MNKSLDRARPGTEKMNTHLKLLSLISATTPAESPWQRVGCFPNPPILSHRRIRPQHSEQTGRLNENLECRNRTQ